MNLALRLFRYSQAQLGIGGLNHKTEALLQQPKQLIRTTFAFAGAFLAPIQVEEELEQLVVAVQAIQPKRILEIGTSMGGTLYLWTRIADPKATIVSVDLPGGQFGGGYSVLRTPLYQRFARPTQNLHLLRADSHSPETLAQVKSLIPEPLDFLFIDGDHTYEGVRQDWETYSPLVRPGGLIAFHDIAGNYEDTQVKRLWDEVKVGRDHSEFCYHPRQFYGIGLIRVPAA